MRKLCPKDKYWDGMKCSKPKVFVREYNDLIKDMIEETKRTGLEHGIAFCEVSKKIYPSTCVGEECSIQERSYKCPKGDLAGTLHTHPTSHWKEGRSPKYMNPLYPSMNDVANVASTKKKFGCVATDEGRTTCFSYNHESERGEEFRKIWWKFWWYCPLKSCKPYVAYGSRMIREDIDGKQEFLEVLDKWDVHGKSDWGR